MKPTRGRAFSGFAASLLLGAALCLFVSAGCATPYRVPPGQQAMNIDEDIKRTIYASFELDLMIARQGFGVNVNNGVVTLYGSTSDSSAKLRAGSIARGVSGVRGVNNRIATY